MIDTFLKFIHFEKRYSPKTIQSYQTDLTQFQKYLESEFSGTAIQEVNYSLVRSWVVSLVEAKLDSRSINRKIACLRSYYKFLMRQEIISADPMVKIKILKTQKKLPHFVNELDIVKLLDNVVFPEGYEGTRDRLILELFYGTGMRLAELITLKESYVNLSDRTLRVLGKRNKERVIPFSMQLVQLIRDYI